LWLNGPKEALGIGDQEIERDQGQGTGILVVDLLEGEAHQEVVLRGIGHLHDLETLMITEIGVAAFHLVVTSETIEWTVTVLVEALVGDSTVTVALTEDQTETETDMPGDTESCSLLMTIV